MLNYPPINPNNNQFHNFYFKYSNPRSPFMIFKEIFLCNKIYYMSTYKRGIEEEQRNLYLLKQREDDRRITEDETMAHSN
ncbi:hypothetical protein HYC85_029421 [Camellia sinensis]|uniref:Uncharacterized protein n=1 Tax=Camellia sinensis TaxID=4442 RepID=A0A7J7FXY4_CAMSI|nr:hypothetical protein HYC85_029421 [Camellia sinensis]